MGSVEQSGTGVWTPEISRPTATSCTLTAVAQNADDEGAGEDDRHADDRLDALDRSLDGTVAGVGTPIRGCFDQPFTGKAAESHLRVTTSQPTDGARSWMNGSRVRFRPSEWWPEIPEVAAGVSVPDVEGTEGSRGREGTVVDTWLIVLIVVVAVVVLLLAALLLGKRSRVAQNRKREQAREHLQEAHVRGAQAEKERALAEEQAARARRERAEVEERAALAEQEARERAAHAEEERAAAEQLRAKAQKLAPDLADGHSHRVDGTAQTTAYPDQPGGGGATRR